ncbi:glycosyltransferase family 4 protein [Prevotella sp. 10(H)]|uniref:glycosyltransferase family 4 protein n=1 Tax=Prevotella sp. 10(H) TaxID=1158294 RepID=UPI0004A6DE97|nr:glycosyltransferase family 4 protein [Prevotella sp. 10(H)]
MNITFVTTFPSIDIKYWSGLVWFMAKNLEKRANVDYITDLKENIPLSVRLRKKIYGRNKLYWTDRSPEVGKGYAYQILDQLKPDTDIIFSPSSIPLAYLETKIPKVFFTDATFASMLNYYHWFDNASLQYIKEGMESEKHALLNCDLIIYSSQWAADSAVNDYGIDPDKIKVVPFGANVSTHLSFEDIQAVIEKRQYDVCKLLFLGVEWHRKGGDIAVEAVKYLNEKMNQPTELHIVGLDEIPDESSFPPYIINHGRIDKSTKEGMAKLEGIIQQSHFLFMPSRADCTPVVFSEAMSYGVPCISAKTGGIASIINESNGVILNPNVYPEEYSKQIYGIFHNEILYKEMALSAYLDSQSRLNWDVTMDTITKYMKGLLI